MNILITGGCGFLGFNVAKYFNQQGHRVVVLDNLEQSSLLGKGINEIALNHNLFQLKSMGIEVYLEDVSNNHIFNYLNKTSFNSCDAIIHTTGQFGIPYSIEEPRRDMEISILGSFNVLEYAKNHNAKVIVASTNSVYSIGDDEVVFDDEIRRWVFRNEEWRLKGFPVNGLLGNIISRTPYGWGKYSVDLLCQEFYHNYGVKSGVFRMSGIYGPNQFGFEEQDWVTSFAIAIEKGSPITIFGDGNQTRDLLFAADIAPAYDAFLMSNVEHGIYNLGGGPENTTSVNEVLNIFKDFLKKKLPPITYENWRYFDKKCYVSDISLIKELGWEPKISLQKGLEITSEWVKENRHII